MKDPPPADVTVTLRCNNDCTFCPRSTLRYVRVRDRADLESRLEAIRRGSSRVILSGGEVTVLPEGPRIVARCRAMGFEEVALVTNGRRLADASLVDEYLRAGLTEACVTVYDLRPDVHDRLTRTPGSLVETLAGLDNLLSRTGGHPLVVRVNTLLSVLNADGLGEMIRDLAERGVGDFLVADVVLSEAFDTPLPHARVRSLARTIASDPALRTSRIVWRGFPLCVLHGIPGIDAEPQIIDTTIVDDRELEGYFNDFYRNFEHIESCRSCDESTRCPGPQKLHSEKMGDLPLVRPIRSGASRTDDLAGFHTWEDPGRLAVTPTTACQARCTYCQVVLGKDVSPPEILDRAVDLLLTSARRDLELQFFGGEPLLRRAEVMRTMERGRALAERAGKRLSFTLTTNGILLDAGTIRFLEGHDALVLFSCDGPVDVAIRYRPLAGRASREAYGAIEENLRTLASSRVPHFVNIVVTPEQAASIPERLEWLVDLGVRTFQVCYALGPRWDPASRRRFCDALRVCAALIDEHASRGLVVRMQNLESSAEPVILSNDLLVDVDGTLYSDAALFAEKALPGLRDAYRIGSIFDLESFDGLRRTREENLRHLRRVYPSGHPVRETVEEHLEMGRMVQATVDDLAASREERRAPPVRDANPLLRSVILRPLADQARIMERRPDILKLPLLHLENPCCHDCIFCLSKPLPPTPASRALEWLAANDDLGLTRVGLVGNEPLAHPDVMAIMRGAGARGFRNIEALTTGTPLSDPGRVRALRDLGLDAVALPLYGPDASTHDAVTRSTGSFDETLRALDNLERHGIRVHVHTNLLRQNIDGLPALARLLRARGLPFCVIPTRPKDANLSYAEIVPRYRDVTRLEDVGTLVAFPLCIASKVQDPAIPDGAVISDLLKVYVLDQPFVKPPRCNGCLLAHRCCGTFQAYLDLWGDAELEPLRREAP